MSANKPPFPLYDEQRERTGPPNHQSSQLFPPQLRMGQGQGPTTNPYGGVPQNNLAPNPSFNPAPNSPFNPAPNPAFNEEATQAFQPAPFQQPGAAGFGPTGPFQPGSTTASGAFGPAQFLPGGRFNANAKTNPHTQLSPSIGGPTGPFGPTPSGQFGVPGGLSSPQGGRPAESGQLWPPTGTGTGPTVSTGPIGSPTRQLGSTGMTGMLPGQNVPGDYSGDTGMLTLNQAVKVVRVPVPGRPGEFKTGILPVVQQPGSGTLPPPIAAPRPKNKNKVIVFAALILLVVVGSISVLLLHSGGGSSPATTSAGGKANIAATATAQAAVNVQATAAAVKAASLMLFDPLSSNGHSWFTGQSNGSNYFFKGNAYHINPTGPNFGYAFMGSPQLPKNYTYTLTMQSVNYDQNNGSFSFYGMIMDYTNQGGHPSFYIFRVNNGSNISYELDKYDDRNATHLQQLFPDPNNTPGTGKGNGKELTRPHAPNVFSVTEYNGTFTMSVNNVKIGSVKDTTLTGGELGMCASQAGTDAAFTNLYLYRN